MIYLDWNATAPLEPAARAAWLAAQDEAWGNPGSAHGVGQAARHRLDAALAACARLLGAAAHELIVTSGGSEANATAIHAALAGRPGGNVVVGAVEHSSILRNVEAAARRTGAAVRPLGVDRDGRYAPAALAALVDADTRLLCVQYANNELGTLQDVPALAVAARAPGRDVRIHCDACQGPGKRAIDLRALGVDSAAIAGHKFGAPKGIGLLWTASGWRAAPLILGGRQQQDRRSGTEDAALACALAAALAARLARAGDEDMRQRRALDACFARIAAALPGTCWLARGAQRLANTMCLAHGGVAADVLMTRLDLAGFAVSKGSACMAKRSDPSHVLDALGIDVSTARSAIRVSIGPTTDDGALRSFADVYAREVRAMLARAAD